MESYVCPVCKEAIERDLMVFLKHTDQHIIEVVMKEHPEWVSHSGICQECLEYYKRSMGHKPFADGE